MPAAPRRFLGFIAMIALFAVQGRADAQISITATDLSASGQNYNLTALGTEDWVKFTNGTVGSNGGFSPLGTVSDANGGAIRNVTYTDSVNPYNASYPTPNTFSWTNGNGPTAASGVDGGYYSYHSGANFSFEVSGVTGPQVLQFFVESFSSGSNLTVSLSGGGGTANSLLIPANSPAPYYTGDGLYTVAFQPISASQVLTVSLTAAQDGQGVGVEAVDLAAASPEPSISALFLCGMGALFLIYGLRRGGAFGGVSATTYDFR